MTTREGPEGGTKRIPSGTSSGQGMDIEEPHGRKPESVDIIQDKRKSKNTDKIQNDQNDRRTENVKTGKNGQRNQRAGSTPSGRPGQNSRRSAGSAPPGRPGQNSRRARNAPSGKNGREAQGSAGGHTKGAQGAAGQPVPVKRGKKPKRKKSGRKLLIGLLCCIIILSGLGFLVIVLFEVDQIIVTGNQYCSEEEIIDWLTQDPYSENSLYLLWKYNQNDVEQLPAVEETKVGLKDLRTVSVQVKEKTFSGRIDYAGKFLYFDQQGKAALVTDSVITGVPYIEGMEINEEEIVLGKALPEEEGAVYEEIKELIPLLEKHGLVPDKISCAGTDLTLHFGVVRVQIGNGKFSDRLAQVPPILEKLTELYAGQAGVLHLENYDVSGSTVRFVPDTVEASAETDVQTEGEGEEAAAEQEGEGEEAAAEQEGSE